MTTDQGRPGSAPPGQRLAQPSAGSLSQCQDADCTLPGLTVLLVEDEPLVAASLADMVRQAGCQVSVAGDGAEALRLPAARLCDLLVTDYNMPEVDGFALICELRRARPWLPVVVVTGAPEVGPRLPTLFDDALTRLIRKPVEPGQLVAAIAHLACPHARHGSRACCLA